ncbi:ubiquitin carboxyl-terminal hydrolase 43 [Pangasianodon hypophthalmus]|uniref:ubiquitin carboxyl-terminal hydrolase 43 n=1 Tax=Pangasianodon hypophthalmus TaxID=310915 RepID=UPI000EFF6F78|nr:ubiquitin carboxyl-terminal hydrolase 43 [Pangasianodon hypophthalmus]
MEKREQQVKGTSRKSKATKHKDKKRAVGKPFRKKSFKSVGTFVARIFKSLGAWTHSREPLDAEDDDGGFRVAAPCTNSATVKEDERDRVVKTSTLQSRSSLKDRLSFSYGDKTPGVLGLKNHGNTCFMNAVVQCLSNTDLLAEYLGLEHYKMDIGENMMNHADKVRRDDAQLAPGEVTEQLAALVRALWTLEYTPQLSVEFKMIVSKYGSQFRGNSQHDALEFLLWLLDRVHEDVNSSLSSPSGNNRIKPNGKDNAGGEELAISELPDQQPGVRHSFVQEHFQAQYKSSLTCPHCLKQSHTFDPFLCISLPIPLRQTRPLCVTLVFSTKGQRYLRVGLAVPLFGSLACLRRMVADEGKISPDQVILTEIYTTGFQRSFFDEDDLTSIAENDIIYAFQAPPLYIRGGSTRISGYHHSLPSSPYSSSGPEAQRLAASGALSSEFLNHGGGTAKILLLVCNAAGVGQQAVRFGPPFLMREDRSVSWDQLQQSILSKLYYLMISGAQPQNNRVLFKIRVVGGSVSCSYLSPQDGRPLYHPAVDRALKLCGSGGPPHVKLIVEWEHRIKDCLFGNIQEEVVKDCESVRTQQQQHVQQHSCTLDECFQLYTKEEQLAPDDAWKCPHCKQLQQGMVQMSLWTLPDILILHLKRFRQVGERRNKLSTLVRFPLTALDMAPHMVKRSNCTRLPSTWKQQLHQRTETGQHPEDFLYDLYAVCNHHGGMHGGHYTAYCRNSVDGQWYDYDDSSVEPVPEGEVCTRGAYILFYQRRNSIPAWSASCSLRGSTSSSMSNHWLVRLTSVSEESQTLSLTTKASSCSSAPEPQTPTSPVFYEQPKGDADGFESRPFVRGTQGRSVSLRSPTKNKDNLSKVLPLRWSFGSKDRKKVTSVPQTTPPRPGELVEYLESGRRPRCTKEPIVSLVASPAQGKAQLPVEDSLSSPSGSSSFSGAERGSCREPDSPRVPEGQSRPASDRGTTKGRDEGLLARKASKRRQEQHGKTQDGQSRRESAAGLQPGTSTGQSFANSTSESKDSTLKRVWNQPAGATRTLCSQNQQDDVAGSRNEETQGIPAFLMPSNVKKDSQSKDIRAKEAGQGRTLTNKSSNKLSMSNGTPNGLVVEEKKGSGTQRCSSARYYNKTLTNGRETHSGGGGDIKRALSSSSLQSRLDPNLRRTVSLQRNGLMVPPQKGHTTDKPSYNTLQRNRYSTTSLGRQRPVPESCF